MKNNPHQVIRTIGCDSHSGHQKHVMDLSYALAEPYWGQGLIVEAANILLDWIFKTYPHIIRIHAWCDSENIASARVMQKLGMKHEGIFRTEFSHKDQTFDVVHYGFIEN